MYESVGCFFGYPWYPSLYSGNVGLLGILQSHFLRGYLGGLDHINLKFQNQFVVSFDNSKQTKI